VKIIKLELTDYLINGGKYSPKKYCYLNNDDEKYSIKLSSYAIGSTFCGQGGSFKKLDKLWRYADEDELEYVIRNPYRLRYYTRIFDLSTEKINADRVYLYHNLKKINTDLAFSDINTYTKIICVEDNIHYQYECADRYFLFNEILYHIETKKGTFNYSQEEQELLIKEFAYKENSKFQKLKRQIEIFENISVESNEIKKREIIPEEVNFEVWRRDEGKCVNCGSKENLEFDHIIPFSKGGSNTARNLQLLCETCNRKKSNKI